MISSVFTLKDSYVPETLVSVKKTNLVEGYHLNSTLNFLVESHKSLLSCRQDFYRSIVESSWNDNKYTIDESFNEVIYNIKNIIRKNIDYLDVCVKRFETQLNKYIDSDKYIMKKKEQLKNFPSGASFNTSGFEFTFKDDIPSIDIVGLDLNELKDELKSISDNDIISKLAKLSELLTKLSDQKFDQVCGEILGCDPISQVDFMNSVFTTYRDGKSEECTLCIGKEDVFNAVNNYDNYKDMIKQIKTLQNQIINKYKTLENQIDEIIKSNLYLDGNTRLNTGVDSIKSFSEYKSKLSNALDELVVSLTNRIQKISTFHLQAFAGKLDAYNSKIIQDRSILYSALNIMNSTNVELTDEFAIDFAIEETSYDYTRDAAIYDYIVKKSELDLRQQRFVQECLVLIEGNIPELKTINEDLKMDKENIFDRIKAFIKKIFDKFLMKINKLIYNDKEFLTKYKDIITKVKIDSYQLNDMPNFEAGIKNIKNHKMQHLDIKKILPLNEEQIKQEVLPAYKGTEDYKEVAKRYFLCNNEPNRETVQSETLNMVEIYDFCVNASNALSQLKSDKDFVLKESDVIKTKVVAVANGQAPDVSKAASDAAAKDTTKNNETTKTNESSIEDLLVDTYYYSSVLETYITEDEKKYKTYDPKAKSSDNNKSKKEEEGSSPKIVSDKEKENSNGSSNDQSKSEDKVDFKVDSKDSEEHKNLKNDVTQDREKDVKDADKQAEENRNAEAKKVKEVSEWYINALKDVYTCKITSFQKIYQEYMKILRYHVSHATENMDASTDKFTDNDQKEIIDAMKKWVEADKDTEKNENEKKAAKDSAIESIKSAYKSKNIVIDDNDANSLITKNRAKIEKMLEQQPAADAENK